MREMVDIAALEQMYPLFQWVGYLINDWNKVGKNYFSMWNFKRR